MRTPTYLHRNSYGIYYFRMAIPRKIRYKFSGKHEIKRSLRTVNRSIALKLARELAVHAIQLFQDDMNYKDLAHCKSFMSRLELKPDGTIIETIETDPEHAEAEAAALKAYRDSLPKVTNLRTQQPTEPPAQQPSLTVILISEAAEKYIEYMEITEGCDQKTLDDYKAKLEMLVEAVGDISVNDITNDTANDYFETIKKIPSNRKKKPQYRGKTIQQLLNMQIPKQHQLGTETVNKYMTRAKLLIEWCIKKGYYTQQRNPFDGLRLSKKSKRKRKSNKPPRTILTDAEVSRILQKLPNDKSKPSRKWLPILAMYTGARLEELCQLHTSDIIKEDGIYCFRITDSEEDQQLKTPNSIRIVPIHSEIIKKGFLEFVDEQKSLNRERIFHDLQPDQYGKYSSSYSKHFVRYRRKLGIKAHGKCFHSFRHTVVTKLFDNKVEERFTAAIVGHKEGDGFTYNHYGHSTYKPKQLIKAVESIQYDLEP